MTKGLKTSNTVLVPRLDKIQDPEVKRVFQRMVKMIQELNLTYHGDLVGLEERITTLEP